MLSGTGWDCGVSLQGQDLAWMILSSPGYSMILWCWTGLWKCQPQVCLCVLGQTHPAHVAGLMGQFCRHREPVQDLQGSSSLTRSVVAEQAHPGWGDAGQAQAGADTTALLLPGLPSSF